MDNSELRRTPRKPFYSLKKRFEEIIYSLGKYDKKLIFFVDHFSRWSRHNGTLYSSQRRRCLVLVIWSRTRWSMGRPYKWNHFACFYFQQGKISGGQSSSKCRQAFLCETGANWWAALEGKRSDQTRSQSAIVSCHSYSQLQTWRSRNVRILPSSSSLRSILLGWKQNQTHGISCISSKDHWNQQDSQPLFSSFYCTFGYTRLQGSQTMS